MQEEVSLLQSEKSLLKEHCDLDVWRDVHTGALSESTREAIRSLCEKSPVLRDEIGQKLADPGLEHNNFQGQLATWDGQFEA